SPQPDSEASAPIAPNHDKPLKAFLFITFASKMYALRASRRTTDSRKRSHHTAGERDENPSMRQIIFAENDSATRCHIIGDTGFDEPGEWSAHARVRTRIRARRRPPETRWPPKRPGA
ncbi:hypothetical protein, partial [Burkholderia thailandensis]|uniref:hypothetical protein n=1 Tax=Burkholderia thailandensis TaxID=57975 RepID=UPI001CA5743F